MIELNAASNIIELELKELQHRFTEAKQLNDEIRDTDSNKDEVDEWILDLKRSMDECTDIALQHIKPPVSLNADAKSKVMGFAETHAPLTKENCQNVLKRIEMIKDLIQSNSSVAKIKSLHEKLLDIFNELKILHKHSMVSPAQHLEDLELELDICSSDVMEYLEKRGYDNKTKDIETKLPPISDQIKKIELPKFSGNKANYFHWKAAFTSCVDATSSRPEIKLLTLHQYLQGEALKTIEGFGYSAEAYQAALKALEDKYGGERRKASLFLDQVDRFQQLKNATCSEMCRLSDMLNWLIVNLKETKRNEELGHGILYLQLQKKLPNSLLTDFHRWIYANKKAESVISLLEFIELEKSFKTVAEETINGITNETNSKARSYHTKLSCPVCNDEHSIVTCKRFLAMGINERWAVAKKKKLCYKCLKRNHLRQNCI